MQRFEALILWFCLSCTSGQDDIRLPPSVVRGPPLQIIFRSGDPVTLECKGDGVPSVRYEWKKNDVDLNLNLPNIKTGADGTITIKQSTYSDEGTYQCYITNTHGTAVSNTSLLQRAFLEPSSSSSGKPITIEKTAKQGEPFHIEAIPKRSFPKPQYGWEIARDTTDQTPTRLRPSKRMQITDNGDLYFAYALPEDDLDGKFYKSTAYSTYLDLKVGGVYTNVTVTRASMTQFPPALLFSSESITIAVVGSHVSLRCIFGGYPDITISWSGPNTRLLLGGTRYATNKFNTELTITDILPSDQGDYVCMAVNQNGTSQHTLQLLVEASPSFEIHTDGPYDVNVTAGSDITFNCLPDANPEATITWLQNGKPIDTSNPLERYLFSNDKKSLTIKSVCRDCTDREKGTDLTVIQCNASNVHGYVFRSGYMNVLAKTEVIPSNKTEKTVQTTEDQQFDFPCSATSDPSTPPTVRWYKVNENDQEELLQEDPPYLTIKEGTLTIRSDVNGTKNWEHFNREYHCVAFNGYSKATQIVILTVYISNTFWWIYLLVGILVLFLILAVLFAYVRKRDKQKLANSYRVRNYEGNEDPYYATIDSGSLPMDQSRHYGTSSVPVTQEYFTFVDCRTQDKNIKVAADVENSNVHTQTTEYMYMKLNDTSAEYVNSGELLCKTKSV